MKKSAKKILRSLYYNAKQLYFLLSGKPRAKGFVFLMHRVAEWEEGKIFWNENMKISPAKLEEIILAFREKYDFVRLEDVPARLKMKQKRKFVVFSFDDGYRDNMLNALPIFKKYDIPFTIFLTSDFIDRKAILWWYILEDILLQNESIKLSDGKMYNCKTKEEKEDCFLEIRSEILKMNQCNIREQLESFFCNSNIDWIQKCEELCLSWDDVELLSREPLVTLGSHTMHHYNLEELSTKEEVKVDILAGYHRIKDKIDIDLSVFAYPFGNAKNREIDVVREMKNIIKVAVMASGGAVTDCNDSMYSIPRIMLEESYDDVTIKRTANCCVL